MDEGDAGVNGAEKWSLVVDWGEIGLWGEKWS